MGDKFYAEYGYSRDRESQLRNIAGDYDPGLALEAAEQIRHLKSALADLVFITKIHSAATGNNFAWAEIDEANIALNA